MSIETTLTQAGHPAKPRNVRSTGFFGWLILAREVRRQRRALADLTPEQLQDVGLTPDQARREAQRLVWDVPQHWLR